MIDFHSHLLPGVDDGSKNVDETIKMLEKEYQQGVCKIVVTPHFYAGKNSVEHFLKRRMESLKQVRSVMEGKEWAPGLYPGAEVYYFPGMGKAGQLSKLCVEGTKLLLVELPFCQWTDNVLTDVRQMIELQKMNVILAHVERYYAFQKDKTIWDEMIHLPLYLQLNGECFLNWKKRQFGIRLLQTGKEIVLGSDCHNLVSRAPNLKEAREMIRKKSGEAVLDQIDQLGERILQ